MLFQIMVVSHSCLHLRRNRKQWNYSDFNNFMFIKKYAIQLISITFILAIYKYVLDGNNLISF